MNIQGIPKIINYIKDYIGIPAILLILSSLLLLQFAEFLQDLNRDPKIISKFSELAILALVLSFLFGFSHYIKTE